MEEEWIRAGSLGKLRKHKSDDRKHHKPKHPKKAVEKKEEAAKGSYHEGCDKVGNQVLNLRSFLQVFRIFRHEFALLVDRGEKHGATKQVTTKKR